MPHSLRVRLKNLQRKGELTEKDIDRIFKALSQDESRTELKQNNDFPYRGDEKECPCPCGAFGEACMTCPWE